MTRHGLYFFDPYFLIRIFDRFFGFFNLFFRLICYTEGETGNLPAKVGLPRSGSPMKMSTGNAPVPKAQAATHEAGLPRSGSLMKMSTGNAPVPKAQAADHEAGLPRSGSLLSRSTGNIPVKDQTEEEIV